jgi:hypothetical protein
MSIARRFVDMVTQQFDSPEIALAFLGPEIAALEAKEAARKVQRRGNRQATGKPRGRPRLSPEKRAESDERRRELHRLWMRRNRAVDKGL